MKAVYDALRDADGKRELNRRIFDRIARNYGLATRALSFGRDGAWKRELVSSLKTAAPALCLDLATGTGDIAGLLQLRFPASKVIGIDLSANMIARAKARFGGRSGIEFVQGDLGELPFADSVAGVVTGGYALRNVPDLSRTLSEIRRVLTPEGEASFLDFVQPRPGWRRQVHHQLLHVWGGIVGLALHGRPWIYRYIPASLEGFPDEDELPHRLREAGLVLTGGKRFFGGMVQRLNVRRMDGNIA